ncbi:MAG: TrkH family potassium uptake protein [Clostridia bacterium]|nr:TrkH family potassium uptake protein [Clostridia bacterium]
MNYRMIGYLLSIIMLIEAAFLTLPMITAFCYGESILPFLYTMIILSALALPSLIFKPKKKQIYAKEGFVCVAASWIVLSAFGALPFVFSGAIPNYVNAFFETVSGFTTTGATILSEVESLGKGILFWRSFTHWIGGMGVLVFMLAILPSDDGRAIHLLRAEVPGPTKGKLVPKLRRTALILYTIYLVLTVIQVIALLIAGLPFYDSLVTSFATAGTGGFSVMNDSIAGYANPAAEWIIAIFMLIFSINFNLYFFILLGKVRDVLQNEELRAFLAIVFAATVAIVINTWQMFENASHGIRAAFFQVTSIISTTGFATAHYELWPVLSQTILVLLMITGACAGSTAGGFKISRILLVFKNIFREIKQVLRPRSVNRVRMDGEVVPNETIHIASGYLAIYLFITLVSLLLISFDGYSLETNITATISCVNNVGPAFGSITPFGNFGDYSVFSKIVFSLDMLFGRLEIIPMIILFSPSTWLKR